MATCTNCHGAGQVDVYDPVTRTTKPTPCKECDGKGTVPDAK